jgi:flagellin-like hook-associated protein FlgL
VNISNTVSTQAMMHFDRASQSLNSSSRRVQVGNRFEASSQDNVGLALAMKMDFEHASNAAQKINLQNFVTLLQSQDGSLQQAGEIYQRMSSLALSATDPTLAESASGGPSDKELLNKEFGELSKELSNLIDLNINGRRLFGGLKADFTDGLQDRNDFSPTNLPQISSKDVYSTQGKITLELSPGQAADQIWMFQGELPESLNEYFESPANGRNSDTDGLTGALYEYFDGTKDSSFQGIFTTGAWKTSGASWNEYYDKFVIDFDTCDTQLEAFYHGENDGEAGLAQDLRANLESKGEFLLGVPSGNSTIITMIGVNAGNKATYEVKAAFEPSLPYNDIEIPGSDEVFPAISFSEIECADISTTENALKALGEIDSQIDGLIDSRASIGAALSRFQKELNRISEAEVNLEQAKSRISDTDIATESTNIAKQLLKMKMATDVVKKSTRLSDSLIALTTNHFRSHVLNNRLG